MDMRSKDILKRALMRYDGTVVVVSHDREFLDGLVDKVYEFRDGGVREYLGDIWYFLEKRKLESLREVEVKAVETRKEAPKTSNKEDYQLKKEAEKQIRKVENAIAATEKRVGELEKKVADWDVRLADPATHGLDLSDGKVFAAYNELKQSLAHEMHEWEKLNYELEILKDE
jgi:ATP-binding cassette subfamily F protein 3